VGPHTAAAEPAYLNCLGRTPGPPPFWCRPFLKLILSGAGPRRSPVADEAGSYLRFFGCWGFRSRTPGPPPFSSMNSTPAASKARLITSIVARRGSVSLDSNCRIVTTPTRAVSASCICVHSRSARAARHCAGVIMSDDICDSGGFRQI
jgi:hypothetical protein